MAHSLLLRRSSRIMMMESIEVSPPPTKRKRTQVEFMDMDWSPSSRRKTYSPLSSPSHPSSSSPSFLSPTTRSISSSRLSPYNNRKGGRSPLPYSPLSSSHSPRTRSRSPRPHSPLPRSSLIPRSPHIKEVDLDDAMESEKEKEKEKETKNMSKRQRKGGESKFSLLATVKKEVNVKITSLKQPLLGWLQKYLGDPKLRGIFNNNSLI